jgi:hypothetical protein
MVRFLVYREAGIRGSNVEGETALKLLAAYAASMDLIGMMLNALISQLQPNVSMIINEINGMKDHLDKLDETGLFNYIYSKLSSESSFEELIGFEMILILHSPIKFLNWLLKFDKNQSDKTNNMVRLLLKRFKSADEERTILRFLLRFNYFTLTCASKHEVERNSLLGFANKIEEAISAVFLSDNIDHHQHLIQLLIPNAPHTDHHKLLELARSFQDEYSLLSFCLSNNLKILFDKPQVAGIVEKLFVTPLRETIIMTSNNDKLSQYFDLRSLKIRKSLFLRSCPATNYLLDFISKVISLALVGYISIYIYGYRYGLEYHRGAAQTSFGFEEYWMLIILISSILHELGELLENDLNFSEYLHDEWNVYDLLEYTLCLGWFVARLSKNYFAVGRVFLAISAIPQSQGLLRYLSVYRPIGELIIVMKAMTVDFVVFLIIYLLSIFGFGIAFTGLFYSPDNPNYGSVINTILSLFSMTMNNFMFNVFNATSSSVNSIGILLMMLFIVMTSVILLNLLIARMTSSHERVQKQALREWSFAQAQTVSSLILWQEKNSLSMLPPPLNLLSGMFGFIDSFLLPKIFQKQQYAISLAGTFSNFLLVFLIGTILRTIFRAYRLFFRIFRGHHNNLLLTIRNILAFLTVAIWYPIYDWIGLIQEWDYFILEKIDENHLIQYHSLQLQL